MILIRLNLEIGSVWLLTVKVTRYSSPTALFACLIPWSNIEQLQSKIFD